jgi:predicted membrane channel-forming protein YqfA (hemolysin III family)
MTDVSRGKTQRLDASGRGSGGVYRGRVDAGVASLDGSPWKIVSVAIYAFTLMVLYSASTVYHSVRGRKKRSCRRSITFRSTC